MKTIEQPHFEGEHRLQTVFFHLSHCQVRLRKVHQTQTRSVLPLDSLMVVSWVWNHHEVLVTRNMCHDRFKLRISNLCSSMFHPDKSDIYIYISACNGIFIYIYSWMFYLWSMYSVLWFNPMVTPQQYLPSDALAPRGAPLRRSSRTVELKKRVLTAVDRPGAPYRAFRYHGGTPTAGLFIYLESSNIAILIIIYIYINYIYIYNMCICYVFLGVSH